jgi:outer membrane protein assembly factor BamE (lipoprotein component of BamABCDE complex)
MKAKSVLFAHLVVTMLQGCIIIPTTEHHTDESDTRDIIDEEKIAFMKTGITGKEEILLRLGEPEYMWGDEKYFVYHWRVTRGYLIWAGGYAGGMSSLTRDYVLLVQFDQDDHLSRYEIQSERFSDEVKRW